MRVTAGLVQSVEKQSLWATLLLGAVFLIAVPSTAKADMPAAPSQSSGASTTSTGTSNGNSLSGSQGRIQVPCTCRYRGNDYQQGETACIRGRLARCDMVLNNTSWAMTEEICPAISQAPSGLSTFPASSPQLAAITPFRY